MWYMQRVKCIALGTLLMLIVCFLLERNDKAGSMARINLSKELAEKAAEVIAG